MRVRIGLAALWPVLWLASLLLPVAALSSDRSDVLFGWQILLIGWMYVLGFQFGWFANVAFFAAVVRILASPKRGALNIFLATLIALPLVDALSWNQVPLDPGPASIKSFGIGYYMWITAMLGAIVSLLWKAPRAKQVDPSISFE